MRLFKSCKLQRTEAGGGVDLPGAYLRRCAKMCKPTPVKAQTRNRRLGYPTRRARLVSATDCRSNSRVLRSLTALSHAPLGPGRGRCFELVYESSFTKLGMSEGASFEELTFPLPARVLFVSTLASSSPLDATKPARTDCGSARVASKREEVAEFLSWQPYGDTPALTNALYLTSGTAASQSRSAMASPEAEHTEPKKQSSNCMPCPTVLVELVDDLRSEAQCSTTANDAQSAEEAVGTTNTAESAEDATPPASDSTPAAVEGTDETSATPSSPMATEQNLILEEGAASLDDSMLDAGMESTTRWSRRPTQDPRRAAKVYMERHGVANVLKKLISDLARDKPAEPLLYMHDKIAELRNADVIAAGSATATASASPN